MNELIKPEGYEPYLEYGRDYDEPLLDYVRDFINKLFPYNQNDWDRGYYENSRMYSFFAGRYFNHEIYRRFEQRFIENKEVQETIKGFGLDVDKFWYLLLFIYDYSYGKCVDRLITDESPKEQLENFKEAIIQNIKEVGPSLHHSEFHKPITITLNIEGGKKIVVDNPTAITTLSRLLIINENQLSNLINDRKFKNKRIKGGFAAIPESNSVQIWFFAKTFQTYFRFNPQIKGRSTKGSTVSLNKLLLISKLIYITGLSKNDRFLDSVDTIKGYLKQYKGYKIDGENKFYSTIF